MVKVLVLVLPLALAGAVSPVMLSEQTVLLSGQDGRRVAGRYAIGVGATLLVALSGLVAFGRFFSLPAEPTLSATLDVILGSLLLALSALLHVHRRRPRRVSTPRRHNLSPRGALGFGVFSMVTNVTTLAVMVPTAKEIAASDLGVPARVVVILVVVIVATVPAWLPLALALVAPGPTRRGLNILADFINARGQLVTMLLLAAVGVFLVSRGIIHMLGW